MQSRYIASATGFVLMAAVGFASAQSVPVTVSNQGAAVSPSANAVGVTLGTFTLVSHRSDDIEIASIPLTLTTASGGNASDLSSCRVHAADGTIIGTTGFSTPVNGVNAVTFDPATILGGNQSLQYTVRCNTASSISSGASYRFTAGTPNVSTDTTTNTGPALGVLLSATPVVQPGTQDAPLGVITLSTHKSNVAIQVTSLPVNMSFGGGLAANMITDCRVRTAGSLSSSLNSGTNVPTTIAGSNLITFDNPLVIAAEDSAILTLTCDIASSAPTGGTVLLSVTPSAVPATVSGSTSTVMPTIGSTASGDAGTTAGSVLISATGSGPVIPGVPNTGFGGTTNLVIVLASVLAMILGVALLRRRTL